MMKLLISHNAEMSLPRAFRFIFEDVKFITVSNIVCLLSSVGALALPLVSYQRMKPKKSLYRVSYTACLLITA